MSRSWCKIGILFTPLIENRNLSISSKVPSIYSKCMQKVLTEKGAKNGIETKVKLFNVLPNFPRSLSRFAPLHIWTRAMIQMLVTYRPPPFRCYGDA